MSINLAIHADTVDDLKTKLAGILGGTALTTLTALADAKTEELVEELRRRMRPQGYVVNIDPVPALESGEAAATAPPPKRGRPAKDKTTATEPSATVMVPEKSENSVTEPAASTAQSHSEPEPSVQNSTGDGAKAIEPPKPVEPSTVTAAAMATAQTDTPVQPTRDEVIAALNAYAAPRGGQVAGRTMMQEVCGVVRLQDIKPEDYPKLIAALKAAPAAAA